MALTSFIPDTFPIMIRWCIHVAYIPTANTSTNQYRRDGSLFTDLLNSSIKSSGSKNSLFNRIFQYIPGMCVPDLFCILAVAGEYSARIYQYIPKILHKMSGKCLLESYRVGLIVLNLTPVSYAFSANMATDGPKPIL